MVRQPPNRGSAGVLVLIATFHANGRSATVRHHIGDGLHGLPRMIAWSFGLALALLLLIAPTTAKAADPEARGSLLGGLTGGLGDIVEPVEDLIEPVADPLLEPVVQPVTEIVDPVIEPVTEPLVQALVQPITSITEPVIGLVTPVVEPVDDLVEVLFEPVVQPVSGVLTPVIEPVGQLLQPVTDVAQTTTSLVLPVIEPDTSPVPPPPASTPVEGPDLPPAGIELPRFMPIAPLVPGDAVTTELGSAPATPSRHEVLATNPAPTAIDEGVLGAIRTPPATDPGYARSSADPGSATPWWTRLGPIGSFSGVGSGQTLNGFAFGVGAALGLLLLFLLRPPFRVSRLHLAAVFWRPQHFVGPLVPPG